MTPHGLPLKERFLLHVDKTDSCWLWIGAKSMGYGAFSIRAGVPKAAHRISWELFNGPIPEGMCVLHKCDVRACVNPDHLFLGTRDTNFMDAVSKGRIPPEGFFNV